MIKVNGLYKRYGSFLAVDDVSFNIEKGEIVGFLGPNGAGKSTTMNILTGYLSPTKGDVSIDGFDIIENPTEAKRRIGYLPEQPPLYPDMTVKEYLNFIYELKGVKLPKKPHIEEICRLVKIDHVYNRLIKNLSKGYKQRVGIAQALVGNPDVLIMDEPTVGLDPSQIIEIRNLITRLGKNHTIILSSHILSEVQAVCKRVIVINNGKIVADGTPESLSRDLSDETVIFASIAGPEAEIKKVISTINGVEAVACEGANENGTKDYVITPKAGVDIRRDIFSRMADRNWPIYSITTNALTLEQIFLRLTDPAAAPVSADEKARPDISEIIEMPGELETPEELKSNKEEE